HPARSFRELVLEKMRPGDIHTHIFGRAYPSTQNGKVNPDMIKAQEKGVIFDVGHGSGSFVFRHAHTAVRQGFMPNSISTDLYGRNSNGPVINMTNLMTKFLNMGMSLEDVIRCSTINPAREINHPELGNLSAGSPADIAVIDMLTGDFGTTDTGGFREGINGKVKGDKRLQNVMTLFGGQTVFDLYALDAIEWEDIPRDNTYWTSFSGQDW
ncbi:MAG: amidohydrolase family protein, partial [Candidatus Latescibacteria bacterium]|nr:amidohydrolase family protein [Candidatus Latescibacterota bacterium]